MRITAFILLAACLQVSARGHAQGLVTLSLKSTPLETVFKEIQRQTGYNFVYSNRLLDQAHPVDIQVAQAPVDQVLAQCFKDQPLEYSIMDRTILVRERIATPPTPVDPPTPIDVHGRIVNEKGDPLQGVNVLIKGKKQGISTDADGAFALHSIDPGAILVVSFVGYETQEIKLNGRTAINLQLRIAATSLQDIVVNKGYYTITQRLNTGNVSIVKGEDIEKQPVSDPLLALEGRVPGLSIQQTSGVPGAYSTVQLRGTNFIPDGHPATINDPLYLVDGVPFSSGTLTGTDFGGGILGTPGPGGALPGAGSRLGMSPFNMLNPADIESIEVLKDADATAIYGARGANGVILITTKRGKAGPMRVNINANTGVSHIARKIDMLNTQQYLAMEREALTNDGFSGFLIPYAQYYPFLMVWDTTRYTDWQKVLLDRPASYNKINLGISGGDVQTQYAINIGYNQQGTTMPGNYADKKASVLASISSSSLNQRFHVDFSAQYTNDNSDLPPIDMTNILFLAPDAPALYNKNGNLNWADYQGTATWDNPLAYTYNHSSAITSFLNGNLNLQCKILPRLTLTLSEGYTASLMDQVNSSLAISQPPPNNSPNKRGSTFNTSEIKSWIVEPKINYDVKVNNGDLSILVGGTFQNSGSNAISHLAAGFSSDAVITNPRAADVYLLESYNISDYRYNSIYSRIGYNLKEKYLINFTGRRDGSSRFGPNKQFANFGSVGTGWIFTKEPWIAKALPWLTFGKLRASYGSVGSDQIGDYQYLRTYSFAGSSGGGTYQNTQTLSPNGHANPYYAWQINKKLEFGSELGFLNDRINFTASYYVDRTGNQLVGYPTPAFTGFTSVTENLPAVIINSGSEFTFSSQNINSRSLRWSTSLNLSIPNAQGKLVSFPGIENTGYANEYHVGSSLGSRFQYHYLGVDPQTGVYTFSAKDGTGQTFQNYDRIWGQPISQKWFGGIENSFRYKGVTLDFLIQLVDQTGISYQSAFGSPGSEGNQPAFVLDRWKSPGDFANVQGFHLYTPISQQAFTTFTYSDGVITDASYLRLKNVSLSYQLPDQFQHKLHLTASHLYIQCQNLFTITHYKGWDPETQGASLPPALTITAGIQLTF